MEKKKIVLISKLPPPFYGTTIWSEILLNSPLGNEYDLIHFNNNVHKNIATLGRPTLRTALINLKLYHDLYRLLRKTKPDLIFMPISQTTPGFLKDSIFILLSRLYSSRVLLTLHGSNFRNWLDHASVVTRTYTSVVLRKTYGIIVLGKKLKYLFRGVYPEERIYCVPNGGNYAFPPREESSKIRLLYLANLLPSKGIIDVIKSISCLEKLKSKIVLNIAGDWADNNTREQCRNLLEGQDQDIHFLGALTGETKLKLISNSDIFIFPPRAPEGHPFVIIEAMAAGLPIITTDQGAITESVMDGINGFVVEPGNPEQIGEKLSVLVREEDLRKRMGSESRRIYQKKFTEEIMIGNLDRVFKDVLAE